jgi:signal transduction histidine kinase
MKKRFKYPFQYLSTKSIWRYASLLLVVVVPLALIWAGVVLAQHPYSGMTWSFTSGRVNSVDPQGPAAYMIREGDLIQVIEGEPVYQARDFPGKEPGEWVTLLVEQEGVVHEVTIELTRPSLKELFTRFSTLLIALLFWVPGLLVLAYAQPSQLPRIFILFCMSFSIVLSLGSISGRGPLWIGWIFNILVWWVGPLALHLHLLLGGYFDIKWRKKAVRYLYMATLGLSVLDLGRLALEVPGPLLTIKYIWSSLLLILSAGILIFAATTANSIEDRRRSRIAGLAALNAFIPFIFLSMLPETLFNQYILPYEVSFLALSILPLGYSYTIMRYRLIPLEQYVNRAAAYTLLALGLAAVYGTIYTLFPSFLFDTESSSRWVGFLVVLLLILSAHPSYKLLQRWVDRLYYGGWYDDRETVQKISRAVQGGGNDIYSIGQTLCRTLQKTMQLKYVNLLLNDGAISTNQSIEGEHAKSGRHLREGDVDLVFEIFSKYRSRGIGKGSEARDILTVSKIPAQDILGFEPLYWLLLEGRRGPQGLLVLGSRIGGGEFLPQDLEILEAVLKQAGAALENAVLLNEVKQHSRQVKALHRMIITVREKERKQLAHNLHDEIVQSLIGVKYSLSNMEHAPDLKSPAQLKKLQEQIRDILAGLRYTITDLRPPALDSLGLTSLIRSRVIELNSQVPFVVYLTIIDNHRVQLSDEVALTLYRCFQEAIVNVQKHAEADMSVKDDGVGFKVPDPLGLLMEHRHFGLNGIKEQVEILGGEVQVSSNHKEGTSIIVSVPLSIKNQREEGETASDFLEEVI